MITATKQQSKYRLLSGVLVTVSGLIWGALVAILITMTLSLLTGLPFKPSLLWWMLLGLTLFWATHLFRPEDMVPIRQIMLFSAVNGPVVILLLSLDSFGVSLLSAPIAVIIGLVVALWALYSLAWDGLEQLTPKRLSRFQLEKAVVRNLRSFGLVFFTLIVALPFFVLIMTSFKSQQALMANPLDFSLDLSKGVAGLFRSYIELFRDFNFGTYMWNAAIVSVATVILTLMFAVPGAYAVSRLNFKGRKTLSRSILLIYLVPAIVLVVPLYAVFSQLGLRNTLFGLLIVYPATTLPVALYMLQGYFRGLPRELEEAGMMDGCSRLRVILTITLPLSLPALASVSLYVFMIAWNEFLFAFMFLDDPKIFTLSRGVVSLNSSEVPRQHLMAGAVVTTIPILVIFLWAERFLVQGLTSGSVKG